VTRLLQGKSVLEVARMDDEVRHLLNTTIGAYSDDYRGVVRRVITGTLDECVRKGTIPRHTLTGIELAPQIVTAEQYEARNKGMVSVDDDTVRALAEGVKERCAPSPQQAGDPHRAGLAPPRGCPVPGRAGRQPR
jgi:hypothetical protein